MATRRRLSLVSSLALAAAWLVAAGAQAQTQPHTVREIVITSPRVVHERIGRSSNGAHEELISLSHRITYDDLDLSKTADLATLRNRVREAAELGCQQLEKIYPLSNHDPDCVKKAVGRAMPQIRAATGIH